MGRIYRILDYKNMKIAGNYYSPEDVCVALKTIESYSDSFEVMTTNGELVMADFEKKDGVWKWNPVAKHREA